DDLREDMLEVGVSVLVRPVRERRAVLETPFAGRKLAQERRVGPRRCARDVFGPELGELFAELDELVLDPLEDLPRHSPSILDAGVSRAQLRRRMRSVRR